jgi:hypothetical protein
LRDSPPKEVEKMRYKRDEGFRYEFGKPLKAEITLVAELDIEIMLEGDLVDISPEGAKVITEVDIPDRITDIDFSFEMNGSRYQLESKIVWKKQLGNHFTYGLNHSINEELQRELIEEIKVHARNN